MINISPTEKLVKQKIAMRENTLGKRLKEIRQSKNLTLLDLSKLLKVSAGYLSEVENNKKSFSQKTLISLTEKTGINIHWLLTGEGNIFISENENKKLIDVKDIPKENIKEWIDNFWRTATDKEKSWLEIEFERTFPEYLKWIQEKSKVEKKLKTG